MNTVEIGSSYETSGAFPFDSKGYFKTLTEMRDLGLNNVNVLKYPEDMKAQCIETHKNYIWREVLDTDVDGTGVLSTNFVYPDGFIENDIDYSNRVFNFFEISVEASNNRCFTYNEPVLKMCNVYHKINDRPLNTQIFQISA